MIELMPETHNATSENLRKLARLIEMGQPLQARAVSEAIVLCASAWEAERNSTAELLFQAGAVFALNGDDIPAKKMFEGAKGLGHPDAEEQLAAQEKAINV